MRRFGCVGVLLVVVLGAAACSSGKKVGDGGLTTSSKAATATTSNVCKTATLTASEVGVSPTTITVSVIADTGSPLRPGLFQGSVDGVKAWADYINANGGLACRQVKVNALDSKLSGDDAKNAITTACGNSLALVGTTALFLDDMTAAEQCKDKAGQPTGMLDMAVLQTYAPQQCSPVSFAALPSGASCPYSGRVCVATFRATSPRLLPEEVRQEHAARRVPRTRATFRRRSPRPRRYIAAEQEARHQGGRGVRRQRRRHPVELHAVRAGDQVEQLHVRARRSRLRRAPCSFARRRRCRA